MIWDYKYSDKKINSIINCFFVYNYDNDLLYENDQVNKKTKCKGKGETGCDQYFYKLMMIGDCNKWQLFNQPFFNFTFEEKKILSRIISCKKISKFVFRFETIGQLILPVTKVLRFTIFSSSSFFYSKQENWNQKPNNTSHTWSWIIIHSSFFHIVS